MTDPHANSVRCPQGGAQCPSGRPGGTEMTLNTEPNIARPDDFYQALIDAHAGLTDAQSAALNARLILLLANQVGDLDTLRLAIAAAREGLDR